MEENKDDGYRLMTEQLRALCADERLVLPNLCNAAALLRETLPEINWAGFYLRLGGELILGPFQGRTACIRIPWGKGVCGTAAAADSPQCVPDVHSFPGHIACDSRSRSELVIPIHHGGQVVAVLDIDSPLPARFDETDTAWLTRFTAVLEDACDWGDFRVA